MLPSRVGALVTALISAAALAACGVSVNVARPVTITTLKGQLLAGSVVGGGYTAGGFYDSSGSPAPANRPTNWNQLSAACQDWLRGFSGGNGGGGQQASKYAEESISSSAQKTYYVFEWIGDFSGGDPASAASAWAADSTRCGSFTAKQTNASDNTTFNVSGTAAPSFGANTAATQDTYTSDGTSGAEETVIGVFGQEIAMIDVSRESATQSEIAQFTQGLLASATAAIANPNPSPDTGSPDTGSPDTGSPDTGSPDTGSPDTGSPTPTDSAS